MAEQLSTVARYRRPSAAIEKNGEMRAVLATSAVDLTNPWFFSGVVAGAEVVASMLLGVAAVARARFTMTAATMASLRDPVVTANAGVLRFESFSQCNGVYARFDLSLDAWSADLQRDVGTTNVDFNDSMLAALSRVRRGDAMYLSVGEDAVAVETQDGEVIERCVPLSERWVRGFGEVAVGLADIAPAFDVTQQAMRAFVRSLGGRPVRGPLHLVADGHDLRLSSRPSERSVVVGGAERLALIQPLLRFATRVEVHGRSDRLGAVAIELELGGPIEARFTLAISPDSARGFSGEGNALHGLTSATPDTVDRVRALLCWQPALDERALARATDRPADEIGPALSALAAGGLVGFDLGRQAYFHRELPYLREEQHQHPRLRSARRTLAAGGVVAVGSTDDTDDYLVEGEDIDHLVRLQGGDASCTCTWWFRHHGERGPCRHVVAARLERQLREASGA